MDQRPTPTSGAAVVAQHYLDAVEAVPGDPDADELRDEAVNYLERAAYDVRKQHISVFVFQERSLRLRGRLKENSFAPTNVSFNMETWSQDGLRYFVIGDASAPDIDSLAKLFKADV